MADVQQVPVNGFQVPPVPGQPGVPPVPPASNQEPGFVNPNAAPAGKYSDTDVERIVAERLAAQASAGKPAQPAAPAAPAAPAQPTAITSAADDALLNSYTEGFSALGPAVDMERAIGNALKYGKPELVDVKYITETGGEHGQRLVTLATAIVNHVQTQTNAGVQATYDTAGGQEKWNAASAAFNQNAPEHLKQVVVEMLNSGKLDKIKAAAKMVTEYGVGNGFVPQPAQTMHANFAGGNPSQALSKEEFQAGLQALNRGATDYSAKRAALFAARTLGKQLGK